MIGQLATVTGFLGADNDGIFRRLFAQKGIEDRCVRIAGQTRIGVKVIDPVQHETTDINFPGQMPSSADIVQLFDILKESAATHEWFVLSRPVSAQYPCGADRATTACAKSGLSFTFRASMTL